VAHLAFNNELEAMALLREFYGFIPLSNTANGYKAAVRPPDAVLDPVSRADDALNVIVPWDSSKAYNMKEVIQRVHSELQTDRLNPLLRSWWMTAISLN
jgi:propionyl-CoA carboxylase beta chain